MSGVVFTAHPKTKAKAKAKPKNRYNYDRKTTNEKKYNYNNEGTNSSASASVSQKVELCGVVNHRFSVLGVDIEFPFPPYGIQKAMMNKIILALSNKQHCLIESPTGTGKTLVLVCSVLAWQRKSTELLHPFVSKKYQENLREKRQDSKGNMSKPCTCGRRPNYKGKQIDEDFVRIEHDANDESCLKKPRLSDSPPLVINLPDRNDLDATVIAFDDDDDDCKIVEFDSNKPDKNLNIDNIENIAVHEPTLKAGNCQKYAEELCASCMALEAEKTYLELCGDESQDGSSTAGVDQPNQKTIVDPEVRKCRIPKIYYGSRTHKQISQVVREVNKTDYRSRLNMTILSSRDRACINEEVKSLSNRNDRCRELVSNTIRPDDKNIKPICPFYQDNQTREVGFLAMQEHFQDRAFDIEDATNFAQEHRACPFYGLRAIQSKVDITFCPYNYILDPMIRQTMKISLKNSIVILDEAHNIEDTCRDSASFNITSKNIDDITECIKVAINQNSVAAQNLYEALYFFKNLLMTLEMWMRGQPFDEKSDANSSDWSKSINYEGREMMNMLESLDLGKSRLATIRNNLSTIKGSEENENETRDPNKIKEQPALSGAQVQVIEKMLLAIEYMHLDDSKNVDVYKLVVTRSLNRDPPAKMKDLDASVEQQQKYVYEMNLFCMSPAVAFGQVRDQAWSIIVASGTLSPLESLKTELGTSFGCCFEGMHVIRKEQIFATIIPRGPNGIDTNCSYGKNQQLNVQDEIGLIVVDVCKKVPNGVLCFFPSYDLMDKLYQRWFHKGFVNQIRRFGKSVRRESKDLDQEEFEQELKDFNKEAIIQGAILFAVFRGKVSEGIDFADKAARAVITVGIPYPNIKNTQVNLKKKYNDELKKITPTIMSGNDWYSSQGFRALNQALGRCIRHQNDWGAILMLDSRLSWPKNQSNLSKWIRQLMQTCNTYRDVSDGLDRFIASRVSIVDENQNT